MSLYFNEGKVIEPLKFITVSYLDILSHNWFQILAGFSWTRTVSYKNNDFNGHVLDKLKYIETKKA